MVIIMTKENEKDFQTASKCYLCIELYTEKMIPSMRSLLCDT